MQFPGGDLAPARRRRYGGGYGRRRRRRTLGTVLVVLVGLAGAGYYWTHRDPAPVVARPAAKTCTTPSPTAAPLPAPQQVRIELLNGTSRNGLAKSVGQALEDRGFLVPVRSTAPAALPGPTRVVFAPGRDAAAALVVTHIVGAVGVRDPAAPLDRVVVTLGNDFTRLATLEEAAAAAPVPATPKPTGCVA